MRILTVFALLALLTGCAQPPTIPYASAERVANVAYRAPGPATLTLMTMVNNRDGSGGHSALMINGSQRVIFDPAGSFENERVPEQEDVLYGVTPAVLAGYRSAHARSSYHVVSQTIEVTPEQAEIALQLAQSWGPTAQVFCTQSTSGLLRKVPGFEGINQTFYPNRLRGQFAELSGVIEEKYFEDDEGTILDGIQSVVLTD